MFRPATRVFRFSSPVRNNQLQSSILRSVPRTTPAFSRLFTSTSPNCKDEPPKTKEDQEYEKKMQEKLVSDPAHVTTQSSVRHVVEEGQGPLETDVNMGASLQHDIGAVKDTFALSVVPRESRILGLAGTLPYLGTSISTVFLAWDLNKELPTGNSFFDAIFVNHDTARNLLSIIEPLQLHYGAIIISFLGAIHWGLEYAEKKPLYERTRFRYGVGLMAPIIAWPTLYLPIEYALTSQFAGFVALYYLDAKATKRGWTPPWYGAYRFLLTAIVGAAIFVSLVGRAKIGQDGELSSQGLRDNLTNPGIADHNTNWAKLEEKEKERRRKEKEEEEKKAKEEEAKKKKSKGGDKKNQKEDKDDAKNSSASKSDESDKDAKADSVDDHSKDEAKDSKASKQDSKDDEAEQKDEDKEESKKGDSKEGESEDKPKKDDKEEKSEDDSEADSKSKKDDSKKEDSKDDDSKKDSKKDDSKKDDSKKDDKKDSKDDSKSEDSKDKDSKKGDSKKEESKEQN